MGTKGLSPPGDGVGSDKPSVFRPTELIELDAGTHRWLEVFALLDGLQSPGQIVDRLVRNELMHMAERLDDRLGGMPLLIGMPDVPEDPRKVRVKKRFRVIWLNDDDEEEEGSY